MQIDNAAPAVVYARPQRKAAIPATAYTLG